MKHRACLIAFVLATSLLLMIAPARAIVVFDPSNFVENSLTAARSLEEINNQIRQLANQAQQLINEALNLSALPFNIVGELRATLNTTDRLISQARDLGYRLGDAQALFARFYPESYNSAWTGSAMAAEAQLRWLQSLQALQTTISVQAQSAQNLASDEEALSTLVAQSQSALGALSGVQATNQLLALHARQLIQSQQLQITQDRSAALEQARSVAAEARAREVRRRFQGDGARYTPSAVDFYGF
jgi:P-type conjugative transfer protein TrbJ